VQNPQSTIPQLAPMLTPDEQRSYDAAIADLLGRTQQNIAKARSRGPDGRRAEKLALAENFAAQAQQLRRQDPAAAKNLAQRAELLSREAANE
jgi:hypothetical protein